MGDVIKHKISWVAHRRFASAFQRLRRSLLRVYACPQDAFMLVGGAWPLPRGQGMGDWLALCRGN